MALSNFDAAMEYEISRVVSETQRLNKDQLHTYAAWYDVPPRKVTLYKHPALRGHWFRSAEEAAMAALTA